MNAKLMKKAHSDALAKVGNTVAPELQAQLRAVADLPDDRINTADIPEVMDWSGAVRGKFYRPVKQRLTLRIDADVVDYFRKQAPRGGYQTAMNQALRASMLRGLRRHHDDSTGTQAPRGRASARD